MQPGKLSLILTPHAAVDPLLPISLAQGLRPPSAASSKSSGGKKKNSDKKKKKRRESVSPTGKASHKKDAKEAEKNKTKSKPPQRRTSYNSVFGSHILTVRGGTRDLLLRTACMSTGVRVIVLPSTTNNVPLHLFHLIQSLRTRPHQGMHGTGWLPGACRPAFNLRSIAFRCFLIRGRSTCLF